MRGQAVTDDGEDEFGTAAIAGTVVVGALVVAVGVGLWFAVNGAAGATAAGAASASAAAPASAAAV